MAFEESNGTPFTMPVAPAYGNSGFGNGFGGDWAWIILLLVLCGGWGNGFGGGFGGFGGGLSYDFPWLLNGQQNIMSNTNGGFRDAMLNDGITGIRDGITGVSTQLCNGFAGINSNIANGFAQAEIAENSRQMANTNQMFNLQSALQSCCCDNRAGLADLKYTVATENCADRAAVSDGIRDVIAATQAQTQTILTQLCNDKIEQKNDTIAQLRQELLYARGQASQDVQTATLRAGQVAEVDALYDRLSSCPVPTMPVYGQTPIFTCGNSCGCGCNG